LPEGDLDALKASLLNVWSRIPDDALVCPGHGDCAPFSRIRNENVRLLRFLEMADPRDVRPEAV
jgi:glyoxylase-like metal-dependent hydrolase (beta-lactamase superfamily II)